MTNGPTSTARLLRQECLLLPLLLVALGSCSSPSTQAGKADTAPPTARPELERTKPNYALRSDDSIQSVLERFAYVRQDLPDHPETAAFLRLLTEVAKREMSMPQAQARDALIERFKDEPLGVLLFGEQDSEYAQKNPEAALAFCAKTSDSLAGSEVGWAAMSREFEHLRAKSRDAFLARCTEGENASNATEAALSLWQRIDYFRENDKREAALESLRFLAEYPSLASQTTVRIRMANTLREAGLVLESEVIDRSAERSTFAETFRQALLADGGAPESFTACYLRNAPLLADIRRQCPKSFEGLPADPIDAARLGALAVYDGNFQEAAAQFTRFAEGVEALVSEPERLVANWGLLEAVCAVATSMLQNAEEAQAYAAATPPPLSLENSASKALHARLLALRVSLLETALAAGEPGVTLEAVCGRVEACGDMLTAKGNYGGALRLYEGFVNRHPDSDGLGAVLLRMGAVYEALEAHTLAARTYVRVLETSPQTVGAELTQYKLGKAYLAAKDYEHAWGVLETCLDLNLPKELKADVHYHLGLCYAELEEPDTAYAHMQTVIDGFPQTGIAPQALFWLAHEKHITGQQEEAYSLYRRFLDRYPQQGLAVQVRGLAAGLERHFARSRSAKPTSSAESTPVMP